MTMTPDGKAVCDRCGGDVGNGGVDNAVVITGRVADGPVTFHLCLRADETHERCATRVLTKAALADWADRNDGPPPFVRPEDHDPPPDPPAAMPVPSTPLPEQEPAHQFAEGETPTPLPEGTAP